MKDVYTITLKEYRSTARKRVREGERCYNSLKNKDSDYAKAVFSILELNKCVCKVYDNAPDEI